jgi:hypothetical protein
MQLHAARLCIDCQEIHDSQTCPVCSSESFAYISRWIPAPERRAKPRPASTGSAGDVDTYRRLLSDEHAPSATSRWLKRGAFGFAALSAAAWALKRTGTNGGSAKNGSSPASHQSVRDVR